MQRNRRFHPNNPWIKYLGLPVQNVPQAKAWFQWVSYRYVKIRLNVPHPRLLTRNPDLFVKPWSDEFGFHVSPYRPFIFQGGGFRSGFCRQAGKLLPIRPGKRHFAVNQVATRYWLFNQGKTNNSLLTLWKMYYPHKLWISVWKGLSLPVAERDVTSV